MASKTREEMSALIQELRQELADKKEQVAYLEGELKGARSAAARVDVMRQRMVNRISRAIDVLMNEGEGG